MGCIEQSINGGKTWEREMSNQMQAWPAHMVDRFLQVGEELFAVLSNGELLATHLDLLEWHAILPAVQGVKTLAATEQ
jgi:hypothetical protein